MSLKIVIDPPVGGYEEIRRCQRGIDDLPGWRGLVLAGRGKETRKIHNLVYSNGVVPSWLIDLGGRNRSSASTLAMALKSALEGNK